MISNLTHILPVIDGRMAFDFYWYWLSIIYRTLPAAPKKAKSVIQKIMKTFSHS